ncbi:MAG: cell division protein FtsA [Clostridiales bacterium]|nr:cell division protein FtsA [Clostridiales bacterium]
MSNIVAALDIGSSKVCIIIAEMKNKQFNILGVGTSECKGVKKGIIVDIDSTVEAIVQALKQAEHMSNKKIKSVFVNIPGGYTNLYKTKGVIAVSREDREITKEDVSRVLEAAKVVAIPQDKEIIDIIPEQFIVDGYDEIRDPIGMVGVRLEVDANLVVASCTTVQNIIRSIQKAGLNCDGIIVEPLATSSVVLSDDEKELGVALLDIGAETTDISVFKKGSLVYTKVIPVGGNHITNDISIICKISSSDAEKIKRQYGVATSNLIRNNDIIKINNIGGKSEKEIYLKDIAEIMEARISEMLYLVRKDLEDKNLYGLLSAGIVITGGGLFNIKGIQDAAQNSLDVSVRFGYPNFIGVANPIYSASAGTAYYALKEKRTSQIELTSSAPKEEVKVYEEEYEEIDEQRRGGFIEKIKDFFADFF